MALPEPINGPGPGAPAAGPLAAQIWLAARHPTSHPTPSTAPADFTYEKPNILPLAAGSRMRPQPTE